MLASGKSPDADGFLGLHVFGRDLMENAARVSSMQASHRPPNSSWRTFVLYLRQQRNTFPNHGEVEARRIVGGNA
jgi:hypothetical protein